MRRLLLIALLGSGCGANVGGQPCSYTKPCGSGLVCDFTDPDGAVCVDEDADDDGDGLPAKRDFCQHQMGGQYDEDLDQIGDDCDKCPIAPPPAAPDADHDEVDSPCDPDPSTPGDKIAVFDGFNSGALPTGWKATAGVTIRGGVAVLAPTGSALATLTAPLPLVSTHMAILAGWRVDATDTTATENAASVIGIDRRPAGVTTISCGASHIGMDRLVLHTGVSGAQDTVDQLFDPASLYRAALKLEAAQAQCALIGDHDTGAAQAMSNGEAMTEAGVSAKGATIEFSYLLAVQRSSTPGTP